ncbi:MAG: hypothetical protein ACK5QQ_06365 [Cyanobacteriota bacterium]
MIWRFRGPSLRQPAANSRIQWQPRHPLIARLDHTISALPDNANNNVDSLLPRLPQ